MKNRKAEPGLRLINMENVAVEQVEWLLYPFIPYGKVTIIQGDPGEGKTTMVLQIIAKLTKGEPVLPVKKGEEEPTEKADEPVNVIYQTAEDGLGDTIKPRLLAAGADCSKVLVIDDSEQPLTMLDERLEQAIRPVFRRSTRKFPAFLFSLFSFLFPPLDFSLIYNKFLMPFRGFFYWKNFFDML